MTTLAGAPVPGHPWPSAIPWTRIPLAGLGAFLGSVWQRGTTIGDAESVAREAERRGRRRVMASNGSAAASMGLFVRRRDPRRRRRRGAAPERTLELDPVELVAGRSVAGRADLAIVREGIEYRFATIENKGLFELDPSDGEGVIDGTPVQHVRVWLNGATSRLTVEKSSGRPLALAFHGRDGSMRVGEVVRTFTEYRTEGGLTLPTAYTVTLDGAHLPRAAVSLDGFVVNPPVAADLFRVPDWGVVATPSRAP